MSAGISFTVAGATALLLGLWMVKRATCRSGRKWPAIVLIVVGAAAIILGATLLDLLPLFREEARAMACRSRLAELRLAVLTFREKTGDYPKNLEELVDELAIDPHLVRCPSTTMAYGYTKPGTSPAGPDVLCCDAEPHIRQHGVLRFLRAEFRHVILVDGRVDRRDSMLHEQGEAKWASENRWSK